MHAIIKNKAYEEKKSKSQAMRCYATKERKKDRKTERNKERKKEERKREGNKGE